MAAPATLTLPNFKQWAKDCAPAAKAVLMAQAFAELERERVDAYIAPIFARYTFPVKADWQESYGPVVKERKDLYLSDAEDLCANYYEDCDKAHREHGFTGPKGHCPALVAENLHRVTQCALIGLAEPLTGISPDAVYGEDRAKYLNILLGACAQHMKGGL